MTSTYDAALDTLHASAPEFDGGLSNHGPMLAAALVLLNRPNEIDAWVERYSEQLEPSPDVSESIHRQNWKMAMSDGSRYRDWAIFFGREIGQQGWEAVVREWLPRLIPGLSGAAGHGLIRTAYALSQIEIKVNDLRLGELANGLAYWASSFLKLPGITASTGEKLSPIDALPRIKWKHKGEETPEGLISDQLRTLKGYPQFTGVINLVDVSGDPSDIISDLVDATARLQLAHKPFEATLVPFLHSIILPSSIRHILPHIYDEDKVRILQYGWQFVAAIYAIYGQINPLVDIGEPSEDIVSLIDSAIATGNAHAPIAVDICLHEFLSKPQQSLLAATWDAVNRLPSDILQEMTPEDDDPEVAADPQ